MIEAINKEQNTARVIDLYRSIDRGRFAVAKWRLLGVRCLASRCRPYVVVVGVVVVVVVRCAECCTWKRCCLLFSFVYHRVRLARTTRDGLDTAFACVFCVELGFIMFMLHVMRALLALLCLCSLASGAVVLI